MKNLANKDFFLKAWMFGILQRGNSILLIKRENTGYMDGYWAFPGWRLDPGEDVKEWLVRELSEEVGVIVDIESPHVEHISFMSNPEWAEWDIPQAAFIYCVRTEHFSWEPENKEPHKCEKIEWFDLDDLPEKILPIQKEMLKKTFSKGSSIFSIIDCESIRG